MGLPALAAVEVAFWTAAGWLLYTWVGYPVLVRWAARLRPAPPLQRSEARPSLSVVVVARDEEDAVAAKIESCLALDYPRDRFEILVASDGSEDGTNDIVRRFAPRGVRLLELDRRGKASALNAAVAEARGEVLLLTDVGEEVAPDAAQALVATLGDPTVGAVSGELHLAPDGPRGDDGVSLYWRYEKAIRRAESRLDSTVGVTGALWALRRELFVPLDPRMILDDVALPMEIVLSGRRVVFEPGARAWDREPSDPTREYGRKRRTLAGNYQLLWLRPGLLNPIGNRLFWQLVSHKVARLLAPFALAVLLVANTLLASRGDTLYTSALVAQLAFYALAAVGDLDSLRLPAWVRLPRAFVLLHLAAVAGLVAFVRGRASAGWRPAAASTRAGS